MANERGGYNPAKTVLFILIAALLVIGADVLLFDGKNVVWRNTEPVQEETFADIQALQEKHEAYLREGILPPQSSRNPPRTMQQASMDAELEPFLPIQPFEIPPEVSLPQSKPAAQISEPVDFAKIQSEGPSQDLLADIEPASGVKPEEIKIVENPPTIKKEAEAPEITSALVGGRPKIAIIIDDMGLTLRSRQVEVMQAPLTLSYLPYAENLKSRTKIAKDNGHELMVHLPMEAMKDKNGGPRILEVSDSDEEFKKTVEWGLSQFEGYMGLNNHMGSRLTQDAPSMKRLMEILKNKNIYFVDSKTIGSSVAEEAAAEFGIDHAGRDIFLDHEISRAFVDQALRDLEAVARQKGSAIAIGHPHKETIEALKEWLPTLKAKGLELVPVSALVRKGKTPKPDVLVAKQILNEGEVLDGGHYNAIEPSANSSASTAQEIQ